MRIILTSIIVLLFSTGNAGATSLLEKQATDFPDYIPKVAQESLFYPKDGVFEVRGKKRLQTRLLVTGTLVFEPGSQLILDAPETDSYRIIAKEILVKGNKGASIVWTGVDREALIPPKRRKAPSGASGKSSGSDGEKGSNGATGNEGYFGATAPSVELVFDEYKGSKLHISLKGSEGSVGGAGQDGGDGGRGARGRDAKSGTFDCSRGPGGGGDGGNGGNGGRGGSGGSGGDGGSLSILTDASVNGAVIKEKILPYISLSGGRGGPKGEPGIRGIGGQGGKAGRPSGLCSSRNDRAGKSGHAGSNGKAGVQGKDGAEGSFVLINYPKAYLERFIFSDQLDNPPRF